MGSQSNTVEVNKRDEIMKMAAELTRKFDVPHISATEFAAATSAAPPGRFIIVDVRTTEEQAVSRIPGSITVDEFNAVQIECRDGGLATNSAPAAITASPPTKVIAYCTIGYRSSQFAEKLKKQYGHDVVAFNLEGGILAMTHEGLPLVTTDATSGKEVATTAVHVWGKQFALQADGYQPVMFERPLLSTFLSKWFKWRQ